VTFVPDARLFDGHFDSAPILPGVAQIDFAIRACTASGLQTTPVTGLRDVRFVRPITQRGPIDVIVAAGRAPGHISFEIRAAGQVATTGVLVCSA